MWTSELFGFTFFQLFYYFMLYSFLGWAMESAFVSITTKEWVNRGFINGPLCPIYGTGALLILVLLSPVQENLLLLFCGGFLVATVVEYAIAVLLEKLFHASWWDYSKKKFNIKGRVCLERSVEWGLLTVFVMRLIQPAVADFVAKIPLVLGECVGTALMIYLFADAGVTVQQILHLNEKLAHLSEAREELRAKLESTILPVRNWRNILKIVQQQNSCGNGKPEWTKLLEILNRCSWKKDCVGNIFSMKFGNVWNTKPVRWNRIRWYSAV